MTIQSIRADNLEPGDDWCRDGLASSAVRVLAVTDCGDKVEITTHGGRSRIQARRTVFIDSLPYCPDCGDDHHGNHGARCTDCVAP
jgi:hypothetical protein